MRQCGNKWPQTENHDECESLTFPRVNDIDKVKTLTHLDGFSSPVGIPKMVVDDMRRKGSRKNASKFSCFIVHVHHPYKHERNARPDEIEDRILEVPPPQQGFASRMEQRRS